MNEPFDPARGESSRPDDVWQEISRTARRRDFASRRKTSASSGAKIALGISVGLLALLAALAIWQFSAGARVTADVAVPAERKAAPATPPIESSSKGTPVAAQVVPSAAADETQPPRTPPRDSLPARSPGRAPASASPASPPSAAVPPPRAVNATPLPAANLAFESALQQARAALVKRNLTAARQALDTAEKNLPAEDRRQEVAELRALGEQLALFLAAVRAGLQQYEATEEIRWDGNAAVIVEVEADRVALFIERQRHDFTVANMPAELALFFARSAAAENAPRAQLFYGAFHAVDPGGDRAEARRLLQRAAAAGMAVDLLLPVLDQPPLADRRQPVPTGAALEAARDQVQEPLAEAILAAKTGPQKSRLAARLLERGRATQDSALQYAAWDEARQWAITAGDPVLALAAIDALGCTFAVDVLLLKSDALGASVAGSGSTTAAAKAASAALALSDEAEQAGRQELAGTLADTAYTAARKARDGTLIRQSHQRRQALSGQR